MSVPRWRLLLIGIWVALACIAFVRIGGVAGSSWLLPLVAGVIPPAMLLWQWNEDGPQLIGTLGTGPRRQ